MKILSAAQMHKADQLTLERQGIDGLSLMERASRACVAEILHYLSDLKKEDVQDLLIEIICGPGNNGGDGLAIARILLDAGLQVHTVLVELGSGRSPEYLKNLNRLEARGAELMKVGAENQIPELQGELVVDCLFGNGLNRSPEGLALSVIKRINQSPARVISIDFPSGMFADREVETQDAVVRADLLLSFERPKLAFFFKENQQYFRAFKLLDIGLDAQAIEAMDCTYEQTDQKAATELLKTRARTSHKGSYGHALMMGGSFGKIGAMVLTAKAALRSGCGLVTVYLPSCGYEIMQSAFPEAMVEVDSERQLEFFNPKVKWTALGIGPGMGQHQKTKAGYVSFLRKCDRPILIDADGLNILASHPELLELIPLNSVLTPHVKEFERLVGPWNKEMDRLKLLVDFSKRYACIVVLKDAITAITDGDRVYFNKLGNSGLSTAGSGDVLSGIITGLIAQGYNSLNAARLGVYLHARAADLTIQATQSEESLIASDLLQKLGGVFKGLKDSRI